MDLMEYYAQAFINKTHPLSAKNVDFMTIDDPSIGKYRDKLFDMNYEDCFPNSNINIRTKQRLMLFNITQLIRVAYIEFTEKSSSFVNDLLDILEFLCCSVMLRSTVKATRKFYLAVRGILTLVTIHRQDSEILLPKYKYTQNNQLNEKIERELQSYLDIRNEEIQAVSDFKTLRKEFGWDFCLAPLYSLLNDLAVELNAEYVMPESRPSSPQKTLQKPSLKKVKIPDFFSRNETATRVSFEDDQTLQNVNKKRKKPIVICNPFEDDIQKKKPVVDQVAESQAEQVVPKTSRVAQEISKAQAVQSGEPAPLSKDEIRLVIKAFKKYGLHYEAAFIEVDPEGYSLGMANRTPREINYRIMKEKQRIESSGERLGFWWCAQ